MSQDHSFFLLLFPSKICFLCSKKLNACGHFQNLTKGKVETQLQLLRNGRGFQQSYGQVTFPSLPEHEKYYFPAKKVQAWRLYHAVYVLGSQVSVVQVCERWWNNTSGNEWSQKLASVKCNRTPDLCHGDWGGWRAMDVGQAWQEYRTMPDDSESPIFPF